MGCASLIIISSQNGVVGGWQRYYWFGTKGIYWVIEWSARSWTVWVMDLFFTTFHWILHFKPCWRWVSHTSCMSWWASSRSYDISWDYFVCPRVVPDSDLVLVYDQNHEYLGTWKFNPMWRNPNMVHHIMPKMAHEFIDDDRNPWHEPNNGLYFAKTIMMHSTLCRF